MKNLQQQERLLDLLAEETTNGLSRADKQELDDLLEIFPEWKTDETLALTATAISLSATRADEPMPAHLQSRILANSETFFADAAGVRRAVETDGNAALSGGDGSNSSGNDSSAAPHDDRGFLEKLFGANWLGWAVAAAACIALALNLWLTRQPREPEIIVQNPPPTATPTPPPPSLAEQREQLVAAANDEVQLEWTEFNPKQPRGVQGDIVWSNSQQKGFVRFRNLPVNDQTRESYQLWIFDENQKNPVSAGVFDATSNGEIIIPMNASLPIQKPTMVAVTAEKPGGVVVSALGKVMAVAKVET